MPVRESKYEPHQLTFPLLSTGVIRKKEEKTATQKKSIFQTVDSDGDDDEY
jgi:hypothetical protein